MNLINNINDGSGERLFLIRKALHMKQVDFAKVINSSNGHVSDMEKDRKNITDSTIELLKLKLDVNEEYLRYGTGDMFLKTPAGILEQLKKEFDLDEFSYNLVYAYLKLSKQNRKSIRDFFYNVINTPIPDSDSLYQGIPKTPEELEVNYLVKDENEDAG